MVAHGDLVGFAPLKRDDCKGLRKPLSENETRDMESSRNGLDRYFFCGNHTVRFEVDFERRFRMRLDVLAELEQRLLRKNDFVRSQDPIEKLGFNPRRNLIWKRRIMAHGCSLMKQRSCSKCCRRLQKKHFCRSWTKSWNDFSLSFSEFHIMKIWTDF